jgi:hypothetical protein
LSDGDIGEDEGWPCYPSQEVASLLVDPATSPELFSAVVALTVEINRTRGAVPGATASSTWPQQRRAPLGPDGVLGVAEYVILADADPPYCVLTRVQPW